MFTTGTHGDGTPFDGKGGFLGHAFFPEYSGEIHIDDAEDWTTGTPSQNQRSLPQVAVHEIGHSLGLRHSSVRPALMNPIYDLNAVLEDDDMKGIQKIYGRQNHTDP